MDQTDPYLPSEAALIHLARVVSKFKPAPSVAAAIVVDNVAREMGQMGFAIEQVSPGHCRAELDKRFVHFEWDMKDQEIRVFVEPAEVLTRIPAYYCRAREHMVPSKGKDSLANLLVIAIAEALG